MCPEESVEFDAMALILSIMFIGACAGFVALLLISGDLARRTGLALPGRILLSCGLGMGVIAVSIKVFLVGYLVEATKDYHPEPRSVDMSAAVSPPGRYFESPLKGKWYVLPATAPTPNDEPLHSEIVRLGQGLFNEPGLSANGDVACSSCHKLQDGGDDNLAVSTGIRGLRGTRNAPTVWNAAFYSRLFWDGRADSLEDQAKGPLTNPVEMGMPSHAAVEAAVRAMPGYTEDFRRIFGTQEPVTIDNIALAIASYERTLIAPDTRYDRFVRGDVDALSIQQIRGMALFAGLGCRMCHRDPTFSAAGKINPAGVRKPFPIFSDNEYVRRYDLLADRGSHKEKDSSATGLWRVPSLRNVANTAPYFHNGSVATLEEAVRIMAVTQLGWRVDKTRGGAAPKIEWNPKIRKLTPYRPPALTQDDIDALVAFLESLSIADNVGRPISQETTF